MSEKPDGKADQTCPEFSLAQINNEKRAPYSAEKLLAALSTRKSAPGEFDIDLRAADVEQVVETLDKQIKREYNAAWHHRRSLSWKEMPETLGAVLEYSNMIKTTFVFLSAVLAKNILPLAERNFVFDTIVRVIEKSLEEGEIVQKMKDLKQIYAGLDRLLQSLLEIIERKSEKRVQLKKAIPTYYQEFLQEIKRLDHDFKTGSEIVDEIPARRDEMLRMQTELKKSKTKLKEVRERNQDDRKKMIEALQAGTQVYTSNINNLESVVSRLEACLEKETISRSRKISGRLSPILLELKELDKIIEIFEKRKQSLEKLKLPSGREGQIQELDRWDKALEDMIDECEIVLGVTEQGFYAQPTIMSTATPRELDLVAVSARYQRKIIEVRQEYPQTAMIVVEEMQLKQAVKWLEKDLQQLVDRMKFRQSELSAWTNPENEQAIFVKRKLEQLACERQQLENRIQQKKQALVVFVARRESREQENRDIYEEYIRALESEEQKLSNESTDLEATRMEQDQMEQAALEYPYELHLQWWQQQCKKLKDELINTRKLREELTGIPWAEKAREKAEKIKLTEGRIDMWQARRKELAKEKDKEEAVLNQKYLKIDGSFLLFLRKEIERVSALLKKEEKRRAAAEKKRDKQIGNVDSLLPYKSFEEGLVRLIEQKEFQIFFRKASIDFLEWQLNKREKEEREIVLIKRVPDSKKTGFLKYLMTQIPVLIGRVEALGDDVSFLEKLLSWYRKSVSGMLRQDIQTLIKPGAQIYLPVQIDKPAAPTISRIDIDVVRWMQYFNLLMAESIQATTGLALYRGKELIQVMPFSALRSTDIFFQVEIFNKVLGERLTWMPLEIFQLSRVAADVWGKLSELRDLIKNQSASILPMIKDLVGNHESVIEEYQKSKDPEAVLRDSGLNDVQQCLVKNISAINDVVQKMLINTEIMQAADVLDIEEMILHIIRFLYVIHALDARCGLSSVLLPDAAEVADRKEKARQWWRELLASKIPPGIIEAIRERSQVIVDYEEGAFSDRKILFPEKYGLVLVKPIIEGFAEKGKALLIQVTKIAFSKPDLKLPELPLNPERCATAEIIRFFSDLSEVIFDIQAQQALRNTNLKQTCHGLNQIILSTMIAAEVPFDAVDVIVNGLENGKWNLSNSPFRKLLAKEVKWHDLFFRQGTKAELLATANTDLDNKIRKLALRILGKKEICKFPGGLTDKLKQLQTDVGKCLAGHSTENFLAVDTQQAVIPDKVRKLIDELGKWITLKRALSALENKCSSVDYRQKMQELLIKHHLSVVDFPGLFQPNKIKMKKLRRKVILPTQLGTVMAMTNAFSLYNAPVLAQIFSGQPHAYFAGIKLSTDINLIKKELMERLISSGIIAKSLFSTDDEKVIGDIIAILWCVDNDDLSEKCRKLNQLLATISVVPVGRNITEDDIRQLLEHGTLKDAVSQLSLALKKFGRQFEIETVDLLCLLRSPSAVRQDIIGQSEQELKRLKFDVDELEFDSK